MGVAVIQCPVLPVQCSTLAAVVQNSAAPSEGEISSIIIQVPVRPVHAYVARPNTLQVVQLTGVPVKSCRAAIPHFSIVEFDGELRGAVADRIAIAVVGVVATNFPPVTELRR